MPEPRYSRDEVQAILSRALDKQRNDADIGHDELLDAAREVGVSPAEIEAARLEVAEDRQLERCRRQVRRRQRQALLSHAVSFGSVGLLLWGIDAVTPQGPWALWPIGTWGLGLLAHALAVVLQDSDRLEAKARKIRDKELRRARLEQARAARQGRQQAFEGVIEDAVGSVIDAVADALSRSRRNRKR